MALRPPSWATRVDPIGPVLGLLAVGVYWLQGFDGYLSRDLGLYAYAGQQVADGMPAYEGVVNRSGPLSHLVPGAGAGLGRLLGIDDVLAIRYLFLVLSGAAVWVAFLVGRDLLFSRLSGLASAMALLSVTGFNFYATTGPREKTTLVLLLLCAVLAVGRRRFGWAGVFVSLATLTWQPALFVGVPVALAALSALRRGGRFRGLGRFVLGGLLPLAAFLIFYAAIGKVRLFLDCFVLIHVQYTEQPGAADDLGTVWGLLQEAYGVFLWAMVVGAVAILVGSLVTLAVPSRRRDPDRRILAAAAVGLVAGLLWCLKAFNGWPDVFFLLPLTVLGIGYVVREVRDLVSRRAAVAVTLVWSVLATSGAVDHSLTTQDETLLTQRAEVAAVFEVLPPDATVVSIEAPQPLVLTGRTNPYPHQMFDLGLDAYVDATWPGGLDGFARDLEQRAPTVIARGTIRPDWLMPVLDRGYWEVGTTTGWTWYVNRSVGPEVLAELQEAVDGP